MHFHRIHRRFDRRIRAVALLLAGAAAGVGVAAVATGAEPAGPEVRAADARALVRLLGVEADLEALPREALATVAGSGVPAADRVRLESIVAESFDPERLVDRVARGLLQRWDPRAAATARAWLATPQARGILARGRAAGEAPRCAEGSETPRTTPERDVLLRRVASHTAAPGRARRRAGRLQVAMLAAANDALPASRRLSAAELARAQRGALSRARPEPVGLDALRCHYRDVTSEALARAAAFFESPAGRWAVESVDAALDDALQRAARTAARRVVEGFAPAPASPWRSARAAP